MSFADSRTYLSGRLLDGRSFAVSDSRWKPRFFAPEGSLSRIRALLSGASRLEARVEPCGVLSFDGRACVAVETGIASFSSVSRLLAQDGIELFEADTKLKDAWLTDHGIGAGVRIRGEPRKGRRVDLVFADPGLEPVEVDLPLTWVSVDIETSRDERILTIGIAGDSGDDILFLGPDPKLPNARAFDSEADLLAAFAERIDALDPDVLTGWNAIDFDFRVIARRFEELSLPFDIGRSTEKAKYLAGNGGGSATIIVPGRQVVDALRIVRSGPERYDDLTLETVAQAVLGEGKSVSSRGADKLEELDRLYREDPASFCLYCARDARLVLRILEKTGLDALTVRRAAATGVGIDRAWTSIPAFERLYASALRRRGIAVPSGPGFKPGPSPGGLILEPMPGLFDAVIVLDFKSLYPTLIRTFNIDPLSHTRAGSENDIVAPNGARFSREPGILPDTIADWFARREAARAQGDTVAVHVFKILMNSFYGVLGADGCRYALPELAGAVTSFGQKYLSWTKAWAEAKGFRVLYGDTDSVFIESGLGREASGEALTGLGKRLASELNAEVAREIEREYSLPSHLEIKIDKVYDRFFLPRIRNDTAADSPRGRAKGYAGRVPPAEDSNGIIEIKGMEAARSDGTALGRSFQRELLGLVFEGKAETDIRSFVDRTILAVISGAHDGELVYRKVLRRSPAEYLKVEPPHIRAARILGWTSRRGTIEYLITTEGAQPVQALTAPIDRRHYVEHQVLPIARSVAETLGLDLVPREAGSGQLELEL